MGGGERFHDRQVVWQAGGISGGGERQKTINIKKQRRARRGITLLAVRNAQTHPPAADPSSGSPASPASACGSIAASHHPRLAGAPPTLLLLQSRGHLVGNLQESFPKISRELFCDRHLQMTLLSWGQPRLHLDSPHHH